MVAVRTAGTRLGAPVSEVAPFSVEFFKDSHCVHKKLCEAGPVMWPTRHGL